MPPKKKLTKPSKPVAKGKKSGVDGRSDQSHKNKDQIEMKICQDVALIFQESQFAPNVNSCIEGMLKIMREVDYELAYHPFRECTLFALMNTPEEAPHRKNVFSFIIRFLKKRYQIELEDFSKLEDIEEEVEEDDSESSSSSLPSSEDESDSESEQEDIDELAGLMSDSSDKKKKIRASKKETKKMRKKTKPKKKPKEKTTRLTIVDRIMKDVILEALAADSVTTRVNCCFMVGLILLDVNDIITSIYNSLRKSLVNCMANKSASVRAAAAKCLYRFQEINASNDLVTSAYKFHLHCDPDPKVRQAILLNIEPSKETLETIIVRTKDVKDFVRKAAYIKISNRIHVKVLTIEQRLDLLREGLYDRSPSVRSTVEKKLLLQWLKSCNDDVVELLTLLDIESDMKTIERMMEVLFKTYLSQKQGDRTKLHLFVQQFKLKYLDSRKLLLKKPLTVENTYLWQSLAKFCKQNNLAQMMANDASDLSEIQDKTERDMNFEKEIDDMFDNLQLQGPVKGEDHEMESTGEVTLTDNVSGPTPPKKAKTTIDVEVELIDLILPQPPHLCYFFKRFCQTVDKTDFDEIQLSDYEFIYDQLVKIMALVEISDNAQKKILVSSVREILLMEKLSGAGKLTNVVTPLMQVLAKNVFQSSEELLNFTQELVQEIHNKIFDAADDRVEEEEEEGEEEAKEKPEKIEKTPQKVYSTSETRAIEMKYAKVTLELEEIRDDLDKVIKEQNFMQAEELKHKMLVLEKQREDLLRERNAARGQVTEEKEDEEEEMDVNEDRRRESCSSQQSSNTASRATEVQIADHPDQLFKCLSIFTACLESGSFSSVNTVIQSHLDKICFQGLISDLPEVRRIAVKALGLCCFINVSFAKRYFALLVQIIRHDVDSVRDTALSALFDVIGQHGLHLLHSGDKKSSQETVVKQGNNTTIEGTANINLTEIGDEVKETETEEISDDAEDQFIENFVELILEQITTVSPEAKFLLIQGVCKLLFLGRISSNIILTKLLLIWYDEETGQDIKHFLGVWFPIFAFQDNLARDSSSGQLAFEEAFLPCLETAFVLSNKDPDDLKAGEIILTDKQIENLISFMINLMSETSQVSVALNVSHKFLQLVRSPSHDEMDRFEDKVLSKALSLLSILTATRGQLKELRLLTKKIIQLLPESQRKITKNTNIRLSKFLDKIENLLDQMPPGDDSFCQTPSKDHSTLMKSSEVNVTVRELSQRKLVGGEGHHEEEDDGQENDEDEEIDYMNLSQDISLRMTDV